MFDKSSRLIGKEVYNGSKKISEEKKTYYKQGDHATNLLSKISYNGNKDSIRYAYDKIGNISKIYINEELAIKYQYNAFNQLIREDNKQLNKTLLHRQIKEIVEQELRDLTKNINREEFLTKLIERKKKESSGVDIESKISKLEARKDKLYQLTKKVYDDALNEIIDSDTSSKNIKKNKRK